MSEVYKEVYGKYNGSNMVVTETGKEYSIPENYCSKSHLVEGDELKLIILDDGTFIYKQLRLVDRLKHIGICIYDDKDNLGVLAEGNFYRVITPTLKYYNVQEGDEVAISTAEGSGWATIENKL